MWPVVPVDPLPSFTHLIHCCSAAGSFSCGRRHGDGIQTSWAAGVRFIGQWRDGSIHGPGTLVFFDQATGRELRRVFKPAWHAAAAARLGRSSWVQLKDAVQIAEEEAMDVVRDQSAEYLHLHGTVLAARLNDWCVSVKQQIREERAIARQNKLEAQRDRLLNRRAQVNELRAKARARRASRGPSPSQSDDYGDDGEMSKATAE